MIEMRPFNLSRLWALCCGLCLALALPADGQIAVVVNIDNDVESVSRQQLIDIYTGKMASWQSGQARIYPIAMSLKSDESLLFFTHGLDKSKRQLQRAWLKLALSGTAKPPKVADAAYELLEYVTSHKGAVGFVGLEALDLERYPAIKVIAVEEKVANEAGYLFD